jgi:MFS family permease
MLAVPIGIALSFFASGAIAQAFGWRAALVIAASPAVLLLPALLSLQEPVRGATEKAVAVQEPVAGLLRSATFWWIIASGAVVNFALYAVSTFLPAFLARWHGLSVGAAGMWAGAAHLAGGLAGGMAAGWLGDRYPRRRLMVAAGAAFVAAPFALLGNNAAPGAVLGSTALIAAGYGLLNMYYGLVYAALQDIVGPSLRASAMAIYFLAMYLCGASFGPLITGALSDHLARAAAGANAMTDAFRAAGLQQAMFVVPVLSVVLGVVLCFAARSQRRHTRYSLTA